MKRQINVCFWLVMQLMGSAAGLYATPATDTAMPKDAPIRIAFGSCIRDPDTSLWNALASKNPNLVLFLGDTAYQHGEHFGNVAAIRKLYNDVYRAPQLAAILNRFPIAAVWDDHDFGPNNTDSTFSGNEASRTVFREFWSSPPPPAGLPASVARTVDLGRVLVIMTDNRTYRVNPTSNRPGTMWGKQQLQWIIATLERTTADLVVIASGSQILSTNGKHEALRQFPEEQEALFKAIAQAKPRVVFVSGDRHYAETLVSQIGQQKVFEITSSPLAAPRRTWFEVPTERNRIDYYNRTNNFGLLTLAPTGEVTGSVFDDQGHSQLEVRFKVG